MSHYVATPPNPLCTRALLERVGAFAGLRLELSGFDALVAMWRAEVDEALEDNEELRVYVRELEARVDAEVDDEVEDVPPGRDLVEEVERFLRDQDTD